MTEFEHLFTRDGHVSELSLARLEAGELSADERDAVEVVLASDRVSQAMLAELRGSSVTPPTNRGAVVTMTPRRARALWLPLLGLAIAAGVAAWVLLRPPTARVEPIAQSDPNPDHRDGIRSKGSNFAFELWIDDGQRTFRAQVDDEVHAGDKLAFRVYPRVSGQLLILYIDPSGRAIGCHPSEGFARVDARGDALTIVPGLAFDDAPGVESFVALLCQQPPSREQALRDPDREWPSCEREVVSVRKAKQP